MRACRNCKERTIPDGEQRWICAKCRVRPCSRCNDRPRIDGDHTCIECRREIGRQRKIRLKTCLGCGREYSTKSANSYCPRCLHERSKHPCPDCGVPVDRRAKHCMQCWGKHHRGPNSGNWKGGRVKFHSTRGYVRIKVPDHPRANSGYISEHVYVMEQKIGRFLLPGETVHHKNGKRDDNRPENLELWAKSQPAGQRVEDLLAWAREIIETYGELVSK